MLRRTRRITSRRLRVPGLPFLQRAHASSVHRQRLPDDACAVCGWCMCRSAGARRAHDTLSMRSRYALDKLPLAVALARLSTACADVGRRRHRKRSRRAIDRGGGQLLTRGALRHWAGELWSLATTSSRWGRSTRTCSTPTKWSSTTPTSCPAAEFGPGVSSLSAASRRSFMAATPLKANMRPRSYRRKSGAAVCRAEMRRR